MEASKEGRKKVQTNRRSKTRMKYQNDKNGSYLQLMERKDQKDKHRNGRKRRRRMIKKQKS